MPVGAAGIWYGSPAPTLTYQWLDCPSETQVTNACTFATGSGATTLTYTPNLADTDQYLGVREKGTNASGYNYAYSLVATNKTVGPPYDTVAPVLTNSGLPHGGIFTISTGTWTGATPTYGYTWWRCSGAGTSGSSACPGLSPTQISGQTASSYTTVLGDVGYYLTSCVTATNSYGSTTFCPAAQGPIT
jgi:hypothetical protein